MEQEVPDEVQAAMGLKLVGDVRKLIREEVKAALEDKVFMDSLFAYPLAEAVSRGLNTSSAFRSAVKNIIIQQMQKY
jgi:hypothetical protein